jgi:hypothetical protein
VQEQPRGGNGERRKHRPAAEQPQACAPTASSPGRTRDNNWRANEGTNTTPTPMLMLRCSSGGRRKTLPRGCPEAVSSKE